MPTQQDVLGEIKSLLDISSRVDERVKNIQQNQQELNVRVNQFLGEFVQLSSRVVVLESKNGGQIHKVEDAITEINLEMQRMNSEGTSYFQKKMEDEREMRDLVKLLETKVAKLEVHSDSWQNKMKQYGGLFVQGVWVVIICYVLYKLGLNTIPLP